MVNTAVLDCIVAAIALTAALVPKSTPLSDWLLRLSALATFSKAIYSVVWSNSGTRIRRRINKLGRQIRTIIRRARLDWQGESQVITRLLEYHIFPRNSTVQHLNPKNIADLYYRDFRDPKTNSVSDHAVYPVYWVDAQSLPASLTSLPRYPPAIEDTDHDYVSLHSDLGSAKPQGFEISLQKPLSPLWSRLRGRGKQIVAFFRRVDWLEAEALIKNVPAGDYRVYWYFVRLDANDARQRGSNPNPFCFLIENGEAEIPHCPMNLRLRAGLPDSMEEKEHGTRDGKVELEDPDDQVFVNLEDPQNQEDTDERTFPLRFSHSLHHPDGGDVRLHMFQFNKHQSMGLFAWGGCKIVPLSRTVSSIENDLSFPYMQPSQTVEI